MFHTQYRLDVACSVGRRGFHPGSHVPLVKACAATGHKTGLESSPRGLDGTDICTPAFVVNHRGKRVARLVNVDFAVTNRADPTFSNIINGRYNA